MASAMKDVINAAAGLTAFALESARELVQYMVRRGQMTQDEADKLMRDVEEAHGKSDSRSGAKMKASVAPRVEKAVKVEKAEKVEKAVKAVTKVSTNNKAKSKPAPKAAKNGAKKNSKKR